MCNHGKEKCAQIYLSLLFQVFPLLLLFFFPASSVPSEIRFKAQRVLSRGRRSIAPGATWQILTGLSVLQPTSEFMFSLVHSYDLDYLFGGNAAYLAALQAAAAAANASAAAEAAVLQAAAGNRPRSILDTNQLSGNANFLDDYRPARPKQNRLKLKKKRSDNRKSALFKTFLLFLALDVTYSRSLQKYKYLDLRPLLDQETCFEILF